MSSTWISGRHGVAFLIETGAKSGPASAASASSARTFDSAYAVSGFSGALSSTASSEDAPYMLQDDENTNRRTPASRAARASETVDSKLISRVSSGLKSPIGS